MSILVPILRWLKPLIVAFILVAVLQVTGLLSSIQGFTQAALLTTGAMNADTEILKKQEVFDYKFTVRNTAGERIEFDQYKGKVVFLNIWATWCGPCRREMPTIQQLYTKMDSTEVVFVMLSIDKDSDEAKVGSYISKYKYTFPVYRPSGYLTEQLNVPYIPTTLVINKKGMIVSKEVGGTNFDTPKFRKFLLELEKE